MPSTDVTQATSTDNPNDQSKQVQPMFRKATHVHRTIPSDRLSGLQEDPQGGSEAKVPEECL